MEKDMIERGYDQLIMPNENCRIAHIDGHQSDIGISAIVGHLVQFANLTSIIANIKKGYKYVVQVPTHLQAALNSGRYTMLHGEESGKTWATIVKKLSNGKNEFIANCPIKEEAFYVGNPIQDMASSFASLQMQQQIASLTQMLGETYDAILRVEKGQTADRLGQLNAGRDLILQAINMKDEESRKLQMVIARGKLQEAQSKIGEVLKQKVESFQALPKNAFARFFKELAHEGYLDKRDDEYNIIQDYFNFYLTATQLVGESYLFCEEKDSAALVFEESKRFVENLDFSQLQTIVYSHPQMEKKDLFIHEAISEVTLAKTNCFANGRLYDYIELTLDGDEILEVLENA